MWKRADEGERGTFDGWLCTENSVYLSFPRKASAIDLFTGIPVSDPDDVFVAFIAPSTADTRYRSSPSVPFPCVRQETHAAHKALST